jgi:hypothetical protein
MIEKVAELGLVREKDYMYYLADNAVWKVLRGKRGAPVGDGENIAEGDFEMDANYIYFVDAEGDVSREEKARSPRRATKRKLEAGDHVDVDTPSNLALERASLLSAANTEDAPTIFTFGYEGCGMGTARFVAAVDAIERARGFELPLWVDVRISRKVRALGFRERALEHLVGAQRYQWMSDLGNEGILEGGEMRIRRPAAVSELLARALDAPRRRVIFFCSCSGGFADCHRHEVGRLLLRHARETRARVRLIDWPGGEPVTLVFQVGSTAELDRKTLDTEGRLREEEAAAVPWGSHGILRLEDYAPEHVLLGPALFGENQTVLRIAEHLGADLPADPMAIARKWRAAHATEAATVNGDGR